MNDKHNAGQDAPAEAVADPDTGIVYFPDDDAPNPHASAGNDASRDFRHGAEVSSREPGPGFVGTSVKVPDDGGKDAGRLLAEATVYDTLMDTEREFPVDTLALAKSIVADLIESGTMRVLPPGNGDTDA